MPMLTDFFEKGILSESVNTAIITLIHKKDKDVTDCASFRPISLPADFKMMSKLIACRLENLMPQVINPDQSSFVRARYATDKVRRLLNIIDHSALHNRTALLLLTQKKRLIGSSGHTCLFFWINSISVKNVFAGSKLCIAIHKIKHV